MFNIWIRHWIHHRALWACALMFAFVTPSHAQEADPTNWPCQQRLDPNISLAAVWNGPSIEAAADDWWRDGTVFEAVEALKDPLLTEDEINKIVDGFAQSVTGDKKEALIALFAGVYQNASERRRLQQRGILRFAERQDQVTRKISEASKKLRQLRKDGVDKDDQQFVDLTHQMEWNTRVYDERARLTDYMCEEPVFTVQNLGLTARIIQTHF